MSSITMTLSGTSINVCVYAPQLFKFLFASWRISLLGRAHWVTWSGYASKISQPLRLWQQVSIINIAHVVRLPSLTRLRDAVSDLILHRDRDWNKMSLFQTLDCLQVCRALFSSSRVSKSARDILNRAYYEQLEWSICDFNIMQHMKPPMW